jgi:ASC-1-like (ASCH) protein
MWFRDAKPGKTYLESAQNLILANMGPGVSTGVNMVGAVDDFSNGRIIRGLEKLVPAFFRGSLTAYRLDKEGAETKGGADMLKREEINTLNLIATTLGFQSSRLARIQEHNFQMQKQITEAQNKRASILKRLDEVVFDAEKGPTELKTVFNQIREHNKRYPMEKFLIEADTIDSSLKTYAKKRGLTYRGQYMDEKLIPYLLPSAKRAAPIPEKE